MKLTPEQNENTRILKELETNSEMGLVQGAKMIEAVDGLEPVMEGILLKTNELVEETKNSKSQVVINVEGDVESIKGEKGDAAEIDYDKVREEIKTIYNEDIKKFKDDLSEKLQTHAISVQSKIQPNIEEEVDQKFTEFAEVFNVEISTIKDNATETNLGIQELEKAIEAVSKKVDDIKIPEYDFSIYAKKDEIKKEVAIIKEKTDEKLADTLKKLEKVKQEAEKSIEEAVNNQNDIIQKVASKTVSLTELDDVNLDGLTQTNGKYDLGSGSGSSTKGFLSAYITTTPSVANGAIYDVVYDSILGQVGDSVSIDTNTGYVTLSAGKKYFVHVLSSHIGSGTFPSSGLLSVVSGTPTEFNYIQGEYYRLNSSSISNSRECTGFFDATDESIVFKVQFLNTSGASVTINYGASIVINEI